MPGAQTTFNRRLGLDSVLLSSLFGTVEGMGAVAAELEGGEDGGGMVVLSDAC
jgi:hypothetical protein